MIGRSLRAHVATTTFVLSVMSIGPPLFAQSAVRVTIPGTAFTAEGRPEDVATDNVAGGRRFRGKGFAKVIVRGTLQLPAPSAADPRMQRLVVQFRTSPSGPSLRSVELRSGSNTDFHIETQLAGDFTTKDATQPQSQANAWAFNQVPIKVFAQSIVRLEVQFPGGFDSQINPGEFVLTSVLVDFPRKAVTLPTPGTSVTTGTTVTTGVGGRGRPTETSERATTIPAVVRGASNGVIYLLSSNNELVWYSHSGHTDGTFRWASPQGKTVGRGWDFKQVFSGGDGVIYAITPGGDLLWFRHDGRGDGSFTWAAPQGKVVGSGWNFKHVFEGGDGVIYVVTSNDELVWYRHDGRGDGSFRWAAPQGKTVGTGWNFKQLFAGDDGVIYALTSNNELLWYRHDGRDDGSFRWAASQGKTVGTGWNFKHLFYGGEGVIYAVTFNDELLWYRHDGRSDGSFKWAAPEGKKVGTGWVFKDVFSGERPGS